MTRNFSNTHPKSMHGNGQVKQRGLRKSIFKLPVNITEDDSSISND
jgi:hypothetical protein